MKTSKLLTTFTLASLLCAASSAALAQTAPAIDGQPSSQTVMAGDPVTFTVSATGDPLLYQWYFNDAALLDATNSSLTIASAQLSDVGNYVVVVTNDLGGAISDVVTLTVTNAPTNPSGPAILDFNDDGNADLLWLHPDGRIAAWLMDGTNVLSTILLPYTLTPGWKMAGQADFDQDGKVDFLWQHSNGRVALWLMDGTNRLDTLAFPRQATGGWRVVGVADLDQDGSADIVWQHGNGRVAAWMMDGTNFDHSLPLNDGKRLQGGWKIVALSDMDDDGDTDILWQHGGGRLAVWYMDGVVHESSEAFTFAQPTSSSWHLTGYADLNGDGENDLIWQNSDGYADLWLMNGTMEPTTLPLKEGKKIGTGWTLGNH